MSQLAMYKHCQYIRILVITNKLIFLFNSKGMTNNTISILIQRITQSEHIRHGHRHIKQISPQSPPQSVPPPPIGLITRSGTPPPPIT